LLELGGERVPASFAATVAEALAAGRRHGAVMQLLTQQLIATLAAERIRSAALKGPQLGELAYGDPGRRLSNDIHLLVAPRQLPAGGRRRPRPGPRPARRPRRGRRPAAAPLRPRPRTRRAAAARAALADPLVRARVRRRPAAATRPRLPSRLAAGAGRPA